MANLNRFMPNVMALITQKKRDEALDMLRQNWADLTEAERKQALKTLNFLAAQNGLQEIVADDLTLVAA